MIPITLSLSETTRSLIAREYRTSKEPLVGVVVENYSKYRDELYKNRSAQKTDSLLANRLLDLYGAAAQLRKRPVRAW